ncbi:hypothetical protein JCM21714_3855 [Gracilibacillus boraciitolerans JCM 21714]|uniref:Uncharacterized protein n=1 Tax=Gracilibacillus boraciitolerans JCM 21714 TaxID=1298598 RepID=W4VMM4_9BACI|nr:hypothetical protein JCM21714_3855 [Gracilibacillus boraciitolerans JCM 21714]
MLLFNMMSVSNYLTYESFYVYLISSIILAFISIWGGIRIFYYGVLNYAGLSRKISLIFASILLLFNLFSIFYGGVALNVSI